MSGHTEQPEPEDALEQLDSVCVDLEQSPGLKREALNSLRGFVETFRPPAESQQSKSRISNTLWRPGRTKRGVGTVFFQGNCKDDYSEYEDAGIFQCDFSKDSVEVEFWPVDMIATKIVGSPSHFFLYVGDPERTFVENSEEFTVSQLWHALSLASSADRKLLSQGRYEQFVASFDETEFSEDEEDVE